MTEDGTVKIKKKKVVLYVFGLRWKSRELEEKKII